MDNSEKIGLVALVVLFLAWFIYFVMWNEKAKIKFSTPAFGIKVSQTSFMIVIIVLLLVFMIRQEVQMDELKVEISSLRSEQQSLSRDIGNVEDAVYSTCN